MLDWFVTFSGFAARRVEFNLRVACCALCLADVFTVILSPGIFQHVTLLCMIFIVHKKLGSQNSPLS